jgi:hypothetical protein
MLNDNNQKQAGKRLILSADEDNKNDTDNYYGGGIVDSDVNTGEENGEGKVGGENSKEVIINENDILINEDNIGGGNEPDPDES